MSPNAAPLTAIERARLAYEQMKRRQHDAAVQRRARERSRNITLAVICGGTLAADRRHRDLQRLDADTRCARRRTKCATTDKFDETRTGQVRSFVKGNTCQELQFNNDSGVYVGGNLVPCDGESKPRAAAATATPKGARLNSIRDAFTR